MCSKMNEDRVMMVVVGVLAMMMDLYTRTHSHTANEIEAMSNNRASPKYQERRV